MGRWSGKTVDDSEGDKMVIRERNFATERLETEQFLVKTTLKECPWQWLGASVHMRRSKEETKKNNWEMVESKGLSM